MEQRKIITSYQGRGRFLRSLPEHEQQNNTYTQISKNLERYSLREAYEVRQALEVKAMELVVRNASDQDLLEIEAVCHKVIQRFYETNTTSGEFELHRLYAKKTGSQFMEQTLDLVLSATFEMMQTTSHDILDKHQVELEAKQHKDIVDALLARDSAGAQKAMYNHLQDTIDYLK